MTLKDLVSAFTDDILLSVREVADKKEKLIISFRTGEESAIRDDIINRPVEELRVEIEQDINRVPKPILIIVLGEAVQDEPVNDPTINEPSNNEPTNNEPTNNEPATNEPAAGTEPSGTE